MWRVIAAWIGDSAAGTVNRGETAVKKRTRAIVTCAFVAAMTTAGMASATASTVKPNSSGGGCFSVDPNGSDAWACISASGTKVTATGYIYKTGGGNLCEFAVVDKTEFVTVLSEVVSCSSSQKSYVFTGVSGDTYYSITSIWKTGSSSSSEIASVYSPDENVS